MAKMSEATAKNDEIEDNDEMTNECKRTHTLI